MQISETSSTSSSSEISNVFSDSSPQKSICRKRSLLNKTSSKGEDHNLSIDTDTPQHGQVLERVFHYFDADGDRRISATELQSVIGMIGGEMSLEQAEAVVRTSDSDGDGLLGFEDFVKLIEADGEEEKRSDLWEAFRMYEMEGLGCITPKSLMKTLSRLGDLRTIEECTVMIRVFDLNGDGVLSFDEFTVMMSC